MNDPAIGIDVGGTKIAGALVERDGSIIHDVEVPTPRSVAGADPGARATAEIVSSLLAVASRRGSSVTGIGIGIPEYVDPTGRRASALVLDWPDELDDALPSGVEVVIESDVRCAARAESVMGHGAALGSCLYVSIGTGISHTLVIDGRLWSGARGEAIALGELRVAADDVLVPDAPMTVEGQASGRALERVATRLDVDPLASDADLDQARDRAGRIVGAAIADLVAVLDPAVVVVGGGLGMSGDSFSAALAQQYAASTGARPGAPPLVASALGDRAGRIGAGLLVHRV
jgi:glucokinase